MKIGARLATGTFVLLVVLSASTRGEVDYYRCGLLTAILFPFLFLPLTVLRMAFRPRNGSRGTGLDAVLFTWPTGDEFTAEDLVKSIFIYGKIGSGKSSGSGRGIMRAILALGAGVLFLCSKPEDRAWIVKLATEAGRAGDLMIFAADTELKCNFIDQQMKAGVDSRGITEFMISMKEVLSKSKHGSKDPFWENSEADEFMFSIEPLRLAYGRVDAHEIREFISTSPKSAEHIRINDDGTLTNAGRAYRAGFHYQTMVKANRKLNTDIERSDFQSCKEFWNSHYIELDSKPRSSIEAGMRTTLNVFGMGIVRDKISDTTNVSPEDLDQGNIIVVDYPVGTYSASGRVIMAGWKYITQKHVLRRVFDAETDKLIIIYSDEAQNLLFEPDAKYIDECRSHGSGLVFLTQSISNYRMALGEDAANALVGQAGHSVFHVVDSITGKFAEEMVGSALLETYGGSQQAPRDEMDRMLGAGQWTGSVNQSIRPIIEARQFSIGRMGGKRGGLVVDSFVHRAGVPFRDRSSCIRVAWPQQ